MLMDVFVSISFFLIYMGAQFGFRHRLTAYILLPMPTSPVWLSWLLFLSLSYPHYFPSCGCLDDSMYSYLSVWCINPKRLLFYRIQIGIQQKKEKKRTKWNKRKSPAKMIICCLSKERRYFKYVYNTRVGQSVQCVFHRLLYHKYTGCK